MGSLTQGGYTQAEVMETLESASVQLDMRVEVQTRDGVRIMDLPNMQGGKITHDAERPIRETMQILRVEPAGIGCDFDNAIALVEDFTEYTQGARGQYTHRQQNNGELDIHTGTLCAFVYNSFAHDDVDIECECARADVAGLVGRFQNKNNYYLLQFFDDESSSVANRNKFDVYRFRGGAYQYLGGAQAYFKRGMPLYVRMRITGSMIVKIEIFVNDILIGTLFDSDGIIGAWRAGVWCNTGLQTYLRFAARPVDVVDYHRSRFAPFMQIRMPALVARTENTAAQFNLGTRASTVVSGNTIVLSGGAMTGTYTSPALALTSIEVARRSAVSWAANVPASSSIKVETSTDNGASWQQAINNSPIPSMQPGVSLVGKQLLVRVTLARTDVAAAIALQSLTVRILSASVMGEFIEVPMGKFIMTTPKVDSDDGVAVVHRIDGYDLSYPLSDEIATRLSYLVNTKVTDAVKDILTRAGITNLNVQDLPMLFATTREFEPKKTYFAALEELCEYAALDYYVDANGTFNVFAWIDPQQRGVTWRYRTNERSLVRPVVSRALDSFDVPNRIYMVVSETDKTTVLTATVVNDDPDSPVSTSARGFTKTFSDYAADAPDEATLIDKAKQLLFKKSQVIDAVGFATINNPGHGHEDMIELIHDTIGARAVYVEKAWELSFNMTANMSHDVERLVRVGYTIE